MEKMKKGFKVQGKDFEPFCYVQRVDEPEFGCEGRPDNELVYGTITIINEKGTSVVKLEEKELWKSGLDDNMWIGVLHNNDLVENVTVREGVDSYSEVKFDMTLFK